MALMLVLHCTHCQDEREFEQPPCVDGHGFDCPEVACVECGSAVMVSWSEVVDDEAAQPVTLATAV